MAKIENIRTHNYLYDNHKDCIYQRIKNELKGFWSSDVWNPHENPFGCIKREYDGKRTFYGRYLRFTGISSSSLKNELKYALYQKLIKKEWSISTLHHGGANYLCRIIKWLSEVPSDKKSFLDGNLDGWLISLRTWLTDKNLIKYRKQTNYNKEQEAVNTTREDDTVRYFINIYRTIEEVYDEKDFFDRDIWVCLARGGQTRGRIDLTKINQGWLNQLVRCYLKIVYITRTPVTAYYYYRGLKFFSKFLLERFPSIEIEDFNRTLILEYLGYVYQNCNSYTEKICCIGSVRLLLEACIREGWAKIPPFLFSYEDYPKKQPKSTPKYIPEEVIQKLKQNLDALPEFLLCAVKVLMDTGIRISELINMDFNCLSHNSSGHPFVRVMRAKTNKEDSIPISENLCNAIKEQQNKVISKFGNSKYLFPSPVKKGKPICVTTVSTNLNKIARTRNICSHDGNIWHFHAHQFRHTVGTSMINNGVPQHIVQRYLGHESPTMTMIYAHIHDETLRKEIEKYHESRVVNFQGETSELDETTLSSNDDLEWFSKKIQCRALEHGYCARPKRLGDCDIPGFDGCYNCPHWRTNKNFLPVLKDTLERTDKVLEKAKNCGWELQIHKNIPIKDNLKKVIKSLEEDND